VSSQEQTTMVPVALGFGRELPSIPRGLFGSWTIGETAPSL
jgi:hypothetical protein